MSQRDGMFNYTRCFNPLKAHEPNGALGIGKIRTSGPYKVN